MYSIDQTNIPFYTHKSSHTIYLTLHPGTYTFKDTHIYSISHRHVSIHTLHSTLHIDTYHCKFAISHLQNIYLSQSYFDMHERTQCHT